MVGLLTDALRIGSVKEVSVVECVETFDLPRPKAVLSSDGRTSVDDVVDEEDERKVEGLIETRNQRAKISAVIIVRNSRRPFYDHDQLPLTTDYAGMVKVFRASLDLRDDIHDRLINDDWPNLHKVLTRWCNSASSNTSRLPRFLVLPLQPCGTSAKLCQERLEPPALARVQALLKYAAELDIQCYLAEIKTSVSTVPSPNRLKDESKPAKILRLETLDGSAVECATGGKAFGQSFFVPVDPYTIRTSALPKKQRSSDLVCKFRDLVPLPFWSLCCLTEASRHG